VRTFNAGLLRDGTGWLFAYRVVTPDGRRRIGICRLDAALEVVPGSPRAFSDHVRFRPDADYPEVATHWFADPRLYRFSGRLYIYWNSGWHEPRNHQFIQELDPVTLTPRPDTQARELLLRSERQKLEKNWTFFDAGVGGSLRAVYSIVPHRVLAFSLEGTGDVGFEENASSDWSINGYPANHGGLRGGAPPCRFGDEYWSFCHSVHDGPDGYRYLPAVYAFGAETPYTPTARPIRPLILGNPFGGQRTHERLNPAVGEVVYPCGAAHDGARWLVSHGINDEYCAISLVDHAELEAAVERLPANS
jgi:predicted GH43/DUF377 family glycosyl hydrolase